MTTSTLENQKREDLSLYKAIFLMGPTASGKTASALELRKIFPLELISVDSALIYRGMDIGTAKPKEDELRGVQYRLVDIMDPAEVYSVADFRREVLIQMNTIIAAGQIPLLVGGTMFYFKTLLKGLPLLPARNSKIREKIKKEAEKKGWSTLHNQLKTIDPVSAARIHPNDRQRLSRALEVFFVSGKTLTELTQVSQETLPYHVYQFAIAPSSRELLHKRIEERFHHMLAAGFEEEVKTLFSRGDLNKDMPSIRCVGYRQMWSYLEGEISYAEMVYKAICATKQLAKRQMTWLRGWQGVHWFDSERPQGLISAVLQICR